MVKPEIVSIKAMNRESYEVELARGGRTATFPFKVVSRLGLDMVVTPDEAVQFVQHADLSPVCSALLSFHRSREIISGQAERVLTSVIFTVANRTSGVVEFICRGSQAPSVLHAGDECAYEVLIDDHARNPMRIVIANERIEIVTAQPSARIDSPE